eukprot:jgi/Bigna1/76490/fgenesh1_pg.41_\
MTMRTRSEGSSSHDDVSSEFSCSDLVDSDLSSPESKADQQNHQPPGEHANGQSRSVESVQPSDSATDVSPRILSPKPPPHPTFVLHRTPRTQEARTALGPPSPNAQSEGLAGTAVLPESSAAENSLEPGFATEHANNERLAARDDHKDPQPTFLSREVAPEPVRKLHGTPHRTPSSSARLTERVITAIVPDWKERVTPNDFVAIKWQLQSDSLWIVGKMDEIEGKAAHVNWLPLQGLESPHEAVSPCDESRVAVCRPDGRSVFDRVLENGATIQSLCSILWSEQSPLPRVHPKVPPLRRKVLTDAAILLAEKLPVGAWDDLKLDTCDLASLAGDDDQPCAIAKGCIRQACHSYQSLHVETETRRVCAATWNAKISIKVVRTMLSHNTLATAPARTTPTPATDADTPSHPPTRGQDESLINFVPRRLDHVETVDQRNKLEIERLTAAIDALRTRIRVLEKANANHAKARNVLHTTRYFSHKFLILDLASPA